MKWARFLAQGREHQGVFRGGLLVDEAGIAHDPEEVTWLLPFLPGKVLGLALNYREHAQELGLSLPSEPALFWKPNNSLLPHRGTVLYPKGATCMHPEVELAVVIGRPMKKVRAASAMDYVLGFTIVNDLVVRDFVHGTYRPPIRAKGHDTFGPMGPFLVTADEVPDPHNLALATYVNDKLVQQGRTSQMLLTIPEILEFVSSFMTLQPYDVILTGTPPGISPVKPKDVMKVVVEGLGELENPVEEEP